MVDLHSAQSEPWELHLVLVMPCACGEAIRTETGRSAGRAFGHLSVALLVGGVVPVLSGAHLQVKYAGQVIPRGNVLQKHEV